MAGRIVNKYSQRTQNAWYAMLSAKMLWLKDRSNKELEEKYLSLKRLTDEMFEEEDKK